MRPSDDPDAAIEAVDGRDETPDEEADRNWTDILQELRVSQTGTQIIAGFLLAGVFQQRFTELNTVQLTTYGILVALATISTALGIATVALHRATFRRHQKPLTVTFGDRLLKAVTAVVSILAVGVAFFIFDVAFGLGAGILAGVLAAAVFVALTTLVPFAARRAT